MTSTISLLHGLYPVVKIRVVHSETTDELQSLDTVQDLLAWKTFKHLLPALVQAYYL